MDDHAVLAQLLVVPLGLLVGHLPASRLGRGRRPEQRILRRLVERVEGLLIDDHRVLRQPGLGVVEILDVLESLGVEAGGAGGHHRIDHARGHRLRQFRDLHGHRLRAHELCDPRRGGAVSAPLESLQVGGAVQGSVCINPLRRPGHGVQQLDALFGELVLEHLFLGLVQLHRVCVAGGEKRNAVEAEQGILVLEIDQQDLARLRLIALDRALDLVGLEQRRVGVNGDLELAAGRAVDVGDELGDVLGVEVGRGICGRHVPFGLRGRGHRDRPSEQGCQGSNAIHRGLLQFAIGSGRGAASIWNRTALQRICTIFGCSSARSVLALKPLENRHRPRALAQALPPFPASPSPGARREPAPTRRCESPLARSAGC